MTNRALPANTEAEKVVLGGIIHDNTMVGEASKYLVPDDFFLDSHRRIYRVILNLDECKRPIDTLTIAEGLGRELESVGGVAYLASLTDSIVRRQSISYQVKNIREKSNVRRLIHAMTGMIASAQEGETYSELSRKVSEHLEEYRPIAEQDRELLISAARFCSTVSDKVDWLIEGILPKGGNGIIAGEPKASKSWIADEIVLSLASGTEFMGQKVPRMIRCALFSREDYEGLTKWRLKALYNSRVWESPNFFDENVYVNTRGQSDDFSIENPEHRAEVIDALLKHRIEFAVFDVLNILHGADENDNSEMRKVMNHFTEIQTKSKCQLALVHHLGKADGKWTRRLRGASSIHGWVEWLIGVTEVDPDSKIRKMEFELKASQALDPIYYQIDSVQGQCSATIKQVPSPEVSSKRQYFQ